MTEEKKHSVPAGIARFVRERRSIRKFNSEPVSGELILELLETAARWNPLGIPVSWRCQLADNPASNMRLADAMLEQATGTGWGKLLPARLKEGMKKRFVSIPAHLVVIFKVDPADKLGSERNYAAVCGIMQTFQLLGWEKRLGMLWDTEPIIQNETFFRRIGLGEDERVAGILHIGYFDKPPKARPRTPAEQKWTIYEG
ncbi:MULTISPECIES: nitroreductase family protein [Paenibacillus]|uniref:nitroreductase family protein n=1 Tax=Paenibacillus TaxID=44249 RepID=UPI002FE414F9